MIRNRHGILVGLAVFGIAACGRQGFVETDYDIDIDALPALTATPNAFDLNWVRTDVVVDLGSVLNVPDAGSGADLLVHSDASWLSATLAAPVGSEMEITLAVDPTGLTHGEHTGTVTIFASANELLPETIEVRLQVFAGPSIHVGLTAEGCPRTGATGCDVVDGSETSFATALRDTDVAPGTTFIMYDDNGGTAYYTDSLALPGDSWLRPADSVARGDIVIVGDSSDGVILLTGDHIRIEDVVLVNRASTGHAINAWPDGEPVDATRDHWIERVVAFATAPEHLGSNGIGAPLRIGPDTTLRHCLIAGFYEGGIDLRGAHRSRLAHNTIIIYQNGGGVGDGYGSLFFDLRGARDLVVTHNLILALTSMDHLGIASDRTQGLELTDNLLQGFADLVPTLDGTLNDVRGNQLADAEIESPLEPRFLADSSQASSLNTTTAGTSLDGIDVSGATEVFPGALQVRSDLTLPRRSTIRVGAGNCGSQACDVTAGSGNVIQEAIWSSWPGGTVEIYPTPTPILGNGVISWPVNLIGMGQTPDETILVSGEDDELLERGGVWGTHDSLLTVLSSCRESIRIENLTLRVDSEAQADDTAIYIEGVEDWSPLGRRTLSRLIVESVNAGSGLTKAIIIGDDVLVQDVLIRGEFETCVTLGPRNSSSSTTPLTYGNRLVNLSCHLLGTGDHAPRAGFDIAATNGALFINVAVAFAEPAPLFRAQRRTDDTDVGLSAMDVPVSFAAHAVTVTGHSDLFFDFAASDGTYSLIDIDELVGGGGLFLSNTDSHLDVASGGIDTGVDPATLDASITAGESVDGIDRAGRAIDRGAYEQGS